MSDVAEFLKKTFIDTPKIALSIPSRLLSSVEKQAELGRAAKKKRADALNRSEQGAKVEMRPLTPPKNGVSDKKKLLDEAKRRRARAKMHPSSGYSLPNEQVDAYTPTGPPISSGQVDPRLPNLSIDNESQAYGRVDDYTPTDPSEEARRKMSRYTRGTKQ